MLKALFKRREKPIHSVRLEPLGTVLNVKEGRRILDAALDEGIAFPSSCRVGGCGTCKCRLVQGDVKQFTDSSYVLTKEEVEAGFVLGCQSTPLGSVVVELPDSEAPIVDTAAELRSVSHLAEDALRVTVELETALTYRPGQYANVSVPGVVDRARSYSFSSARPTSETRVQFDVRVIPGGALSGWLGRAEPGATLNVRGPYGSFYLRESSAPLVALAGGTGLGPTLALVESLVEARSRRDIIVLVGARNHAALYGVSELEALLVDYPGASEVRVVLSEPGAAGDGERAGWTFDHLDGVAPSAQAYLCGPPPMIDGALPVLESLGIREIYFDKFLDTSASP